VVVAVVVVIMPLGRKVLAALVAVAQEAPAIRMGTEPQVEQIQEAVVVVVALLTEVMILVLAEVV